MRAWHFATFSGIKLRVHWSFLLLPLWVYYTSIQAGLDVAKAIESVLFVFAIFGCVLLHELGHALAARQFGIPTRDITLLPIGGIAALERMPEKPAQELWIAIAGPLVNVVIATCLIIGFAVTGQLGQLFSFGFLTNIALANIALVIFNMIPAFPMDGGRVLRSIAALFTDRLQATAIAVNVGRVAAIGLGLLGIVSSNLVLTIIAIFIFFAGSAELRQMLMVERLRRQGYSFENESVVEPETASSPVPASLPTSAVLSWMANCKADICDVVDSGRVVGRITRGQVINALAAGAGHLPVGSLVR